MAEWRDSDQIQVQLFAFWVAGLLGGRIEVMCTFTKRYTYDTWLSCHVLFPVIDEHCPDPATCRWLQDGGTLILSFFLFISWNTPININFLSSIIWWPWGTVDIGKGNTPLGCFYLWLLWMMLLLTWVYTFLFKILPSVLLRINPEVEFLGQMVIQCLIFWRIAIPSSTLAAPTLVIFCLFVCLFVC